MINAILLFVSIVSGSLNVYDVLFRAADCGDADTIVRLLLDDIHLVNARDAEGYTPLMAATLGDHVFAMTVLVTSGANLELRNVYGDSALTLAATNGKINALTFLGSSGADTLATDSDGQSALHYACANGRMEAAQYLIDDLNFPVNFRGNNGRTPLIEASQANHPELVRFLLSRGADRLLKTSSGFFALTIAVQLAKIDVIKALIEGREQSIPEDVLTAVQMAQYTDCDFKNSEQKEWVIQYLMDFLPRGTTISVIALAPGSV